MQRTGIVRKIDNLGRIVLPKELRYSINIHPGDDFEIFLDENKIILKKYSKIINIEEQINNLIKTFNDNVNFNILIVVDGKIISNGDKVNPDIIDIIYDRKVLKNISQTVLSDNVKISQNNVLQPIINNGDLLGAVICYGDCSINIMEKISNILICLIKEKIAS